MESITFTKMDMGFVLSTGAPKDGLFTTQTAADAFKQMLDDLVSAGELSTGSCVSFNFEFCSLLLNK